MPLSKDRDRERKRLAKVRLESAEVRLESEDVQPKLPFYTGIGRHFGEVRDKEYAKRFFDELFKDRI